MIGLEAAAAVETVKELTIWEKICTPENLAFMAKGAGYSLIIAICACAGGLVLGFIGATGKMSRFRVPRIIANIYVELFRGTPMLLQILLFYLCGPVLTKALFHYVFTPNPYVVGSIAVAVNSGAYMTELIRAAIQSIDKGQWEAAQTIGLTRGQCMQEIILPQTFKRILPPFINEFIVLIKDSSLLSTIGATELLKAAQTLGGHYFNYLLPLMLATIMYLIMTLVISAIARKIERRLAESD